MSSLYKLSGKMFVNRLKKILGKVISRPKFFHERQENPCASLIVNKAIECCKKTMVSKFLQLPCDNHCNI